MQSSKRQSKKYNPAEIEPKWQKFWNTNGLFSPDLDRAKRPFYNLMMFPYPSAEGLHVGNMYAFTGADVSARFKIMQGYNVFEPIGLDGFGIHSENYALKIGKHPMEQAEISQENFYRQLHMTGNAFDWSRTVETYNPAYYHWTQWIFIQMFKAGLAYRKTARVNWCPSCKTVLADEQVIAGVCERCGSKIVKQDLEQWFFRITDYAERLLKNIEALNWTEKVKVAQRQWIGKSTGALITFKVKNNPYEISVFSTRPDTLFGSTFMVVAPEHELVKKILAGELNSPQLDTNALEEYIKRSQSKTDEERREEGKEKTGVFTGFFVINPVNNQEIPVWIADYVLAEYGTGAIMAVPAHDQRDLEFAKKYSLSIKTVISAKSNSGKRREVRLDQVEGYGLEKAYTGEGVIINSGEWNGWQTPESIDKVIKWLEAHGSAKKQINYHLRDWLISRQRYWGAPIPMIYCESCAKRAVSWFSLDKKEINVSANTHIEKNTNNIKHMNGWFPVLEQDLPVQLPKIEDYKPLGTGRAPLASHKEFYKTKCPHCGGNATRETDVSDTFLDSAWYFFRYLSTERDNIAFDTVRASHWLPVDLYIGGSEHSVLHLLYARFITMFFCDLRLISFEEPFSRFFAHGLIIKDGAKMSKSKGNVVAPDLYIQKYGADTLRMYLLFLGPFSQGGDFRDTGIEGMNRFLKRVWHLVTTIASDKNEPEEVKRFLHKTIRQVSLDLEDLSYNTAIARLMELYNFLSHQKQVSRNTIVTFLKLLVPFAPHLAEELWHNLQGKDAKSIHLERWPEYNAQYLTEDELTIVVQVNGKRRGEIKIKSEQIQLKNEAETLARMQVQKYIAGEAVKRVIYVPGKIINFVV